MPEPKHPRVESRWAEVAGVHVHYQHRPGPGPVLILLPGGMLDSSLLTWKSLLEALPARYRVFSPDLPGYGRSAKPDLRYTTGYYVRFLQGFLDEVGAGRAAVLASSMGAAVAMGFALRHPRRVSHLVLSGAYGYQRRMPLHEAAYLLARVPGLHKAVRRILRLHPLVVRAALPLAVYNIARITNELVDDAYEGVRHRNALRAFQRWMQHDLLPRRARTCYAGRLRALRMPVLILHGEHDWMMRPCCARRAGRAIPRAEVHILPDCGHLVPREQPEAANRLILDFLRRHEA